MHLDVVAGRGVCLSGAEIRITISHINHSEETERDPANNKTKSTLTFPPINIHAFIVIRQVAAGLVVVQLAPVYIYRAATDS